MSDIPLLEDVAARLAEMARTTDLPYRAARDRLIAAGDAAVPALLAQASSPDAETRLCAEIALGWLRDRDLFEACAEDLHGAWPTDARPITGEQPADARADRLVARGAAVTPRLVEMLAKTHEASGRVELDTLSAALGGLEDTRATLPLAACATAPDAAPEVRLAALRALGDLRDDRAAPALVSVLQDRSAPAELRDEAALALAKTEWEGAIEPLLRVVEDQREPGAVRGGCAFALGIRADPRVSGRLVAELARATDVELVRSIVFALGQLGDRGALPAIDEAARRLPTGLVQIAARRAREALGVRR